MKISRLRKEVRMPSSAPGTPAKATSIKRGGGRTPVKPKSTGKKRKAPSLSDVEESGDDVECGTDDNVDGMLLKTVCLLLNPLVLIIYL